MLEIHIGESMALFAGDSSFTVSSSRVRDVITLCPVAVGSPGLGR
jgi:hypothetical protein